jgi:hypothetical protein
MPTPRPPAAATLQEALRWSVEARGSDTAPRHLEPMSEEDRAFLLGAMQGLHNNASNLSVRAFVRVCLSEAIAI